MVGAIISLVSAAVTTAVGGLTTYYNNKSAAAQAKAQGEAQAAAYENQAKVASQQAINEQIKGEQEAAKRSRLLAADIGSQYANYAGNGLMVDGTGKDSLGDILKTTTTEGVSDITTIKNNAAMNMWTYQANASSYRQSAANTRMLAKMQASEFKRQGSLGLWQTATGLPLTSNNGFGQISSGISMGMSAKGK